MSVKNNLGLKLNLPIFLYCTHGSMFSQAKDDKKLIKIRAPPHKEAILKLLKGGFILNISRDVLCSFTNSASKCNFAIHSTLLQLPRSLISLVEKLPSNPEGMSDVYVQD